MLSVVQEAEALFNAQNTFVMPAPEEEDPDDTVAFFLNLARQRHMIAESPRDSKETMTKETGQTVHNAHRHYPFWKGTKGHTSRPTTSILNEGNRTAIAQSTQRVQRSSTARTPSMRRRTRTMVHGMDKDERRSTKTKTQAAKRYTGLQDTPPRREYPRDREGVKQQRTRQETDHERRHRRYDHPGAAMSG